MLYCFRPADGLTVRVAMAAHEFKPDSPYTKDQLEKIGNGIIYLAERIKPLYKTKLLKLLYLLDEGSVKRSGFPMFALDYRAWRMGPVAKELYVDIAEGANLLKEYVRVEREANNDRIEPVKPFDDGEFSDREMELLANMTEAHQRRKASDLIDITHDPKSLWHELVEEKGLLEEFESGKRNTSDLVLDLGRLVIDDPLKSRIYADYQEFLRTHRALQG